MARVHVLVTGGAIPAVSAVEIDRGIRLRGAEVEVGYEQLVRCAQEVRSLAEVEVENFAPHANQEVSQSMWTRLAARINGLFAADAADGVVVTQCADTIEETAYYLHLVVKNSRPVVLTSATYAADASDREGLLNVYHAIAVAADDRAWGRGAILVVDDYLHCARDAIRVGTADMHTFVSPGRGLLGIVSGGSIRYFRRPERPHTIDSQFAADLSDRLPRVDIVHGHVGMPADLVRACVAFGACGIVIAGTGSGNLSPQIARELAIAATRGVVVVRSSCVESMDALEELDAWPDTSACAFDQLNPQKSRILLQLCLARGMGRAAIRLAFQRY